MAEYILSRSEKKDSIHGSDLPMLTAVKPLNALLLYNLKCKWELEAEQLKSPFFDYTNPEVKSAQVKFLNVLSQHIKISSKTITDLLTDAIDDYLLADEDYIRFVATKLELYAKPAIPLTRVTELAKYSPTNRSVLETISSELKSFGKSEVLKGDLQMSLVHRRNRQELIKSNMLVEALTLAYPEYEFEQPLPVNVIEPEPASFFDSLELNTVTVIDNPHVENHFDFQIAAETPQAAIVIPEPIYSEVSVEPQKQIDEVVFVAYPEREVDETALYSKTSNILEIDQTPKKGKKLGEMPRALQLKQQSENLAEKLNRTSTDSGSLLNRINQSPLLNLGKSISLVDKERFISQLFQGDRRAYTTALASLEQLASRQEAESFIKNEMLPGYHESVDTTLLESFERVILRKFSA